MKELRKYILIIKFSFILGQLDIFLNLLSDRKKSFSCVIETHDFAGNIILPKPTLTMSS